VPEGARVCPNGHALQSGASDVVVRAGEATRRVTTVLGASAPHPAEVRAVVVGLKVAALLFAVFTVVGWWKAASVLAQLGVGVGGPLVGLIIGLTASATVYGFALIVQTAARTGTGG
jgi:hypothetical protein